MRKLILSLAAAAGVFAAVSGAEAAPSPHAVPVAAGAPLVQPVQYYGGGGPYRFHRPYGYYRHYGYYHGPGYWHWRRHVAHRWYHHHGYY